jgi:hypothetical protein
MAVIVLFMVGVAWIGWNSQRQEAALAREVRRLETQQPVRELKRCLGRELRLSKFWVGRADEIAGTRNINHMTDIGVVLYDLGGPSRVVITTSMGRPPRAAESQAIDKCVLDAG